MPKYLCFTRTSPGTLNDSLAQKTIIIAGLGILCEHDQIKAYENSDLEFYDAHDVARSELLDSVVVYKLFNKIDTADPDEEIVVVVSKLDRIGVQYNNISFFLDYLYKRTRNKHIQFIPIKEYGLDPYKVGAAVSDYYKTRLMIGNRSSHCNPGKSLPVDPADEMKQKLVDDKSKSIKKLWEVNDNLSNYPLSVIDSSSYQDASILAQLDVMNAWINSSLESITPDSPHKDIKDLVKQIIHECLQTTEENHFTWETHFIYLRNSPGNVCLFINGLPQRQLSKCLALSEVMIQSYKGPWSVVYDSFENRGTTRRDGVEYLFAAVLYGKTDHIIMRNVNRFSSNVCLWMLFSEACKQQFVKIHIADGIGKDVMDMVHCDNERMNDLNVTVGEPPESGRLFKHTCSSN